MFTWYIVSFVAGLPRYRWQCGWPDQPGRSCHQHNVYMVYCLPCSWPPRVQVAVWMTRSTWTFTPSTTFRSEDSRPPMTPPNINTPLMARASTVCMAFWPTQFGTHQFLVFTDLWRIIPMTKSVKRSLDLLNLLIVDPNYANGAYFYQKLYQWFYARMQ